MKNLYKIMTGCITVCAVVLLCSPQAIYATTTENGIMENTLQNNTVQSSTVQSDTSQSGVAPGDSVSTNILQPDNTQTETMRLEKPVISSVVATVKGTVELEWDDIDGAKRYEIYRKSEKQDKYKKIAQTKKTKYIDKTGKANVIYNYQVRALPLNSEKNVIRSSACSKKQKCKVRKMNPKVAYVGDSIMTGFTSYGILKGRSKCKVFAEIGMNTGRFYGSSKMQELLRYNPDRMYIMMGVNGMGSSNTAHLEAILNSYEKIIDACRKKNPNMEIIVMSVAPIRPGATVSSDAISKFNIMLKQMVSKKKGVYYYHMADILADSQGHLLSKYSGGDGVHWSVGTYRYVLENLDKFVEKL